MKARHRPGHRAVPTMHLHHLKIGLRPHPALGVRHESKLAHRQSMDIRNGKLPNKGDPLRIDPLSLHTVSSERIRTIQNDEFLTLLCTGLKALPHRADVSVATAADILHVVNQHIDTGKHLGSRLSGVTVERISR